MPEISLIAYACAVTVAAGFVKGAVGFAMPMIMISGLASVMPADQALATLILPTVVTNLVQALRQGLPEALGSARRFWRLIVPLCLSVGLAAQAVPYIPQAVMLLALGVPIVAFTLSQLAGIPLTIATGNRRRAELLTGVFGGIWGGISGVWGPPTIALLISLNVDKRESVRVQGVVYLIGAVALLAGHLGSGVLNAATLPLSALLVLPGCLGLWMGFRVQDRLDAMRFRRWTLVVLTISGLNLIRRALFV